MIRAIVVAGLVLGGATRAGAELRSLHVLTDSSRVEYHITHSLGDVRDTAGTPSGQIRVERSDGAWRVEGRVIVALQGLRTGIGQRDRHIQSEDYLHVARFPFAVLELATVVPDSAAAGVGDSTGAVPAPERWTGRARGSLDLHGVVRPVEVPVELAWVGERLRVRGRFTILLADHGIPVPKKLMLSAGKSVDVEFDLRLAP